MSVLATKLNKRTRRAIIFYLELDEGDTSRRSSLALQPHIVQTWQKDDDKVRKWKRNKANLTLLKAPFPLLRAIN